MGDDEMGKSKKQSEKRADVESHRPKPISLFPRVTAFGTKSQN